MTEFQKFLIFVSQFDLTYNKINQIIENLNGDVSIKRFCKTKFDEGIISSDIFEFMKSKSSDINIKNYLLNLENQEIKLVTQDDDLYPKKLKNLPNNPFFLFCKGNLDLFNSQSLSVVGTRKPSNYGRIVTKKLVEAVSKKNITIISGLAYGIDSIAHKTCLENGGKTIAVLGSGLNEIYPNEHMSLAKEIENKGLIISEYIPNKLATRYTFPQRNRIIAGLGDGVLITEANFKSGTIHTKDFALEYGKNIYSVPGNIYNETSFLTNDIIKSGQASCITCAEDILRDYNIEEEKVKNQIFFQLSLDEQKIVNLLEDGMKDLDFLTKNCDLNINIFNSCLTTLEIRGIICKLPGGYIVLNN